MPIAYVQHSSPFIVGSLGHLYQFYIVQFEDGTRGFPSFFPRIYLAIHEEEAGIIPYSTYVLNIYHEYFYRGFIKSV